MSCSKWSTPWGAIIPLALTLTVLGPRAALGADPRAGEHHINPYAVLDRLGQGLAVVEENYFEAPDRSQLVTGALRGMVSDLDAHSTYLSPEGLKLFEQDTSGSFGGIGVEVDLEQGEAVVVAPVEGSPADRAGLVPGDAIVRLGGVPLAERKPDEIIQAMRGPVGSRIWLTVRKRSGEFRELELVREAIVVQSVRSAALVGNLLYLRIKSFQEGTHSELIDRIAEFRKDKGRETGIILDLRNNPGGLVREATGVADEFLDGGGIFETRHRGRVERRVDARRGGAATEVPLIVLTNQYSASAAELVAAALKDNRRAKVVGAQTFGKGSVQTVLALSENSAVKLTTALYYSPGGYTLQALGVTPDFPVEPAAAPGRGVPVLTERDLPGHIDPAKATRPDLSQRSKPPTVPVAPPTDEEVHNGVLRNPSGDPRDRGDTALAFAVTLLLQLTGAAPR